MVVPVVSVVPVVLGVVPGVVMFVAGLGATVGFAAPPKPPGPPRPLPPIPGNPPAAGPTPISFITLDI